jgi:anti-anti-sigma regulatory factor
VIFSFFKRKPAPDAGRARTDRTSEPNARVPGDGVSTAGRDTAVDPFPTTIDSRTDPRELARITTAKIDAIESEMIHNAGPATRTARPGVAGSVFTPSGRSEPGRPGAPARATTPNPPAHHPSHPTAFQTPAVLPEGPDGLEHARPHEARADLDFGAVAVPADAVQVHGHTTFLGAAADEVAGAAASGALTHVAAESLAVDVLSSTLPPAFEEAAVLFSNGQSDDAVAILRAAIHDPALGAHERQAWGMLFHLHLCRGERVEFDALALDFSTRFETSPPPWDDTMAAPSAAAAPSAPSVVALPPHLDAQAVRQFDQLRRLAQRDRPLVLDLSSVTRVDSLGAELMLRVLAALSRAGRDLTVTGAQSLLEVVAGTTEAGRRDSSDACWMLQLELLRLLGRQQAFEDLSIEYCVTYEVSPPSWEPLPPTLRAELGPVARPASGRADAGSAVVVDDDGVSVSGELEGRIQDLITALRDQSQHHDTIHLDCARLRRVDFGAAGELLNEIVALRARGKYLRFKDVNHLVGALLAVMGIPDLAEVRLRRV